MPSSSPASASWWRGSPVRVFLLFGVGIVVPAAFLSFLGFRSFQYENQLMRKQMEERHQALSEVIQRKTDEVLRAPQKALTQWASAPAFAGADRSTRLRQLFTLNHIGGFPIDERYWVDDQGRPVFPPPPAPSDPPALAENEVNWGRYADEVQRLEHLEFVDKKPADALQGYMALSKTVVAPSQKAALWLAMAAAAKKSGDMSFATACYQKLILAYPRERSSTGERYAVLARRLLASLYDSQGQHDKAIPIRIELAEGILLGEWSGAYVPDESWGKGLDRLNQLRIQRDDALRKATAFWNGVWPDALQRLRQRGWLDQGGILVLPALKGRERWLLAAPVFSSSGDREGLILALIDPAALLAQAESTVKELALPAGLEGAVHPVSEPGTVRPWTTAVVRGLRGIDPAWRLELWEPPSSDTAGFARRRLWVYGGMVGLSFLVILAGLLLMGQSMRREMELSTLKADFVATVSHELRTPLASITYISDRLSRGRYRSPEEAQEFYAMLGEESRRLQELVEDVLDFSKMLGGKKTYDLKPHDLRDLADEALDRLQGKAQSGGFRITLQRADTPLPVLSDRRAFVQAIGNLLDNALKYSGDSRDVELRVAAEQGGAVVQVTDHGLGIPESEQEQIFEKFYRVEHAESRAVQKGVGLGLAMVKQIVDGHRGRITVVSRPGEGSCFAIWIPHHQETTV